MSTSPCEKAGSDAYQRPRLPDLVLRVSLPITVQLVNGDGECWTATYTSPAIQNDSSDFLAKERAE